MPKKDRDHFGNPYNIAVDSDGRVMPYPPDVVDAIIDKAHRDGSLLALVIKMDNGDLAVPVLADSPSEEIAEALEAAARAYRTTLRQQH